MTKLHKGGRNLLILGVVATLIAAVTTGLSLMIYHNSGDIYLDRSRPGFLPDEEEVKEDENEEEYDFNKTGAFTVENLDEYSEKLKIEIEAVDTYDGPFKAEALSDESLGISEAKE